MPSWMVDRVVQIVEDGTSMDSPRHRLLAELPCRPDCRPGGAPG
jgi:hypothetical protein